MHLFFFFLVLCNFLKKQGGLSCGVSVFAVLSPGVLMCSFISCGFCKLIGLGVDLGLGLKMAGRLDDLS